MSNKKRKESDNIESYCIDSGKYCIADELIAAGFQEKYPKLRNCGGSDPMAIYENVTEDGETFLTAYCYSCHQVFNKELFHSSSHAADFGIEGGLVPEGKVFKRKPKRERITKEEIKKVIGFGYEGKGCRGIKDEYNQFFGHITKLNDAGEPVARYYPETSDGKMMGYKSRILPKSFGYDNYGRTGISNDLSGQVKFKDMQFRDITICGGEEDKVAWFQIWEEHKKKKFQGRNALRTDLGLEDAGYTPMPVVSPTTGEGSAIKQIREQYEFINRAENIYLGLDNDEVGRAAMEEIAKIFPKEKIRMIHWSRKDPNACIHNPEGKDYSKQAISDFYNAKEYDDSGIFASNGLMPFIKQALRLPRISLPEYMSDVQRMCKGDGIIKNRIYNVIGNTSVGKCFSPDTPVLMFDGSVKRIQDIVVGDKVMGADGSPRNVLNTTSGVDQLYRVDQQSGMSYTVNSEHILSLRAGYTTKVRDPLQKGEIRNIKVTDYIKTSYTNKRSLKGYKATLTKLGENSSVFEPYMIGMWLADGSSDSTRICYAKADKELWENYIDFVERNGYSYTVSPSNDRDTTITPLTSGGFRGILHGLNLINNKHIPKEYLMSSYEDRVQLLSGLLDGDGYLYNNGYEITQKNKRLADDIIFLARSLGLQVSVNRSLKKCQNFDGAMYSRMFISGDMTDLKLKLLRKQVKNQSSLRKLHNTSITVTPVGEGSYFGFGVDGDHLFCLEDFTVTHNSTHSNNMVYHFAFLPGEKTAVISLEATKGEYGADILSLHLETNLYWKEADEVQEYLDDPIVANKAKELFVNEDGESRFYVVDDRKGTVDSLEALCLRLKGQYGVTVIVIDVLTDLLRVTGNEDQASHLNWQSNFVKGGVTIFNVLHTRKPEPTRDGIPRKCTEYDAYGSSIFVQKAAGNIVINRNKECPNEDWIERNTTYVDIPKMRQGETGQSTAWLFDPETRQCYNRDKFFEMYPDRLPAGYDLSISSFDKAYYEEGGRGYRGEGTAPSDYGNKKKRNRKPSTSDPINAIPMDDGSIF